MAKDVPNKSVSNNNTDNTTPSISDQQKVPPLRIVLNTSGNQKSSSTAIAVTANHQQQQQQHHHHQQHQQQDLKRDHRSQDTKGDNVLKSGGGGGRVRIKLGTNKQHTSSKSSSTTTSESSNKASVEDAQKFKGAIVERQDNIFKEENTANYSHLRRITRRSQRTIQTVSNEDEESISSMTSTDENQNTTTNNNNSDNNSAQDTATASQQPNSTSATTSTATTTNNSSNAEAPRKYKRRRGEPSESQLSEHDGPFNFQNYKLPVQNSFELYKNIRKQVDKRLKNLSRIHPKTPYGFREYMLTRGLYLLDGNKLGNGTNLFMNEDGGLHSAPIGPKYQHWLRHSRINYSVPSRAKVPLGLPVNSPLYDLFIDQEKERYRMRMQHIKEREKLTLAAEQEIVRVYNQAAMAAANQLEPFSACTMLKHQEIYNYMDSDGFNIQGSEDAQQDQAKQDGVRTRRRHHEQISPPPTRKSSNVEEPFPAGAEAERVQKDNCAVKTPESSISIADDSQKNETEPNSNVKDESKEGGEENPSISENGQNPQRVCEDSESKKTDTNDKLNGGGKSEIIKIGTESTVVSQKESHKNETCIEKVIGETEEMEAACEVKKDNSNESLSANNPKCDSESLSSSAATATATATVSPVQIKYEPMDTSEGSSESRGSSGENSKSSFGKVEAPQAGESQLANENQQSETDLDQHQDQETTKRQKRSELLNASTASTEIMTGNGDSSIGKDQVVPMEQDGEESHLGPTIATTEHVLSDDDRRAYNKEIFLAQLQETDDKWDRIRNEMLIRHKNEAESLYAVQKLEWEWKTKEIGACDVRTTLIIDNTLVPKLSIHSQDY